MDLFPAIDLRDGAVVRLERGDDDRRSVYERRPVAALERYAEAGARWTHVVDLDAAFGLAPQRALVEELAAAGGPSLQVGGGLRDRASIEWAVSAGAARAVVGSLVARDPETFAELAWRSSGSSGPGSRRGRGQGAHRRLDGVGLSLSLAELCRRLRDLPCPAVLGTDVERDGLLGGPNLELARRLAGETGIPSLVSGGVRDLDDVRAAAEVPGVGGVVVGKALYEGALDLAEALAAVAAAAPTEEPGATG